MVQGVLPGGAKVDNLSFDLALNTAVSFITNTNWQAYSGELALSNSTQVFGLTVKISCRRQLDWCSLCIHSWIGSEKKESYLGNFLANTWFADYVYPIPTVHDHCDFIVSQGVVLKPSVAEWPTTVWKEGKSLVISLALVASQVAIKQLGTNGGVLAAFFGANSAIHLRIRRFFQNFIENLAIHFSFYQLR